MENENTNIEQLEINKEEAEQNLNKLEIAKNKFLSKGYVLEDEIPIEDREDFRKTIGNFFKERIAIGETLNQEAIDSLSFYEFGRKPIDTEDFNALALTKEEERNLAESIDGEIEYRYLKERGEE